MSDRLDAFSGKVPAYFSAKPFDRDDKRRAVEAALRHPKAGGLSDREIARHCGVDNATVSKYRKIVSVEFQQIDARTVTRNGTTYKMKTAKIGKSPTGGGGFAVMILKRET